MTEKETDFEALRRILEPVAKTEGSLGGTLTARFNDGTQLSFLCSPSGRLLGITIRRRGTVVPEHTVKIGCDCDDHFYHIQDLNNPFRILLVCARGHRRLVTDIPKTTICVSHYRHFCQEKWARYATLPKGWKMGDTVETRPIDG